MRYFESIKKADSGKHWKSQKKMKCSYCGKAINPKEDHIILRVYWKIKKRYDIKYFCSMDCLQSWLKHINKK